MYDVVVIGSGPGGYVAAIRAAQLGGKVALIEREDIGGTCLNRGCIPTKALFHCAHVYSEVAAAHNFGILVNDIQLDMALVMEFKRKVIRDLVEGVSKLLRSNRIDLIMGEAQIISRNEVSVTLKGDASFLKARSIIIATGSKPQTLPISAERLSSVISSTQALNLQTVPNELIIIGGGVLGIEFASIFNCFGSKVKIIEYYPALLPPIDEEISRRLGLILKKRGISINTGAYVNDIIETPGDRKRVICSIQDGTTVEHEADVVLSAIGRVPDFGGIDLAGMGIGYTNKGIIVDERMLTTVDSIYAIGDVTGKYLLASVASFEGIVAAENAMGLDKSIDYKVIPQCVFSYPEVATVGLKESEAKNAGFEVQVSRFPFRANGRAISMGETEGIVKIVTNMDTREILGVHIMGPHAGELIHEASLAIKLGARAEDMASMMHVHPALSETLMEAASGIGGNPIHLTRLSR
jgi:dihydrolipoamide dehydrogenase